MPHMPPILLTRQPTDAMLAPGVACRDVQTLNGRSCLFRRDVERITRRESEPIHSVAQAVEIAQVPRDLPAQRLGLIGAQVGGSHAGNREASPRSGATAGVSESFD